MQQLNYDIFKIANTEDFEQHALSLFRQQATHLPIYRDFCKHIDVNPNAVANLHAIPFLPIQFFKSHRIFNPNFTSETSFTSSGTTGDKTSTHEVPSIAWYTTNFTKGFERIYGPLTDWVILGLLPSYLEREGSSLVFMVDAMITQSKDPRSGFYLHNQDELINHLKALEASGKQTLLLGVTYALLDLAQAINFPLKHTVIMETGGMKGKRKEVTKSELHQVLQHGFGVTEIHSEYGMTELLSQAYSTGKNTFMCPPWMHVIPREINDPFTIGAYGETAGINVIDLGNQASCAFIETQDLGKVYRDGSFEILGRFDNSDIRGCNLLVS